MRKPAQLHKNGYAVSRDLTPVLVCTEKLKPLGRETRRHPRRQLDKLAASLDEFGFVLPIIIDLDGQVVAGWGLVLAARQLGLAQVPAVTITDLDEAKLRLLRLALNRLGEDSSWDDDSLRLEFSDVLALDTNIDLQISGFEMAEIDIRLRASADDEEDEIPRIDQRSPPITKPGDIWVLDQHRIVCGDALQAENYSLLLGDERAQMVFTDPPWNIPIARTRQWSGRHQTRRVRDGVGRDVIGRIRNLSCDHTRSCRATRRRRFTPFRLLWIGATSRNCSAPPPTSTPK